MKTTHESRTIRWGLLNRIRRRPKPELHPRVRAEHEERVRAAKVGLDEVPAQIGRWRPTRYLGAGGMGEVLLAVAVDTGERAALKIARDGSLPNRQALCAEADTLSRVSHAGLPQILDAGEADGVAFVALEVIDGRDLGAIIDDAPAHGLDARTVLAWFRDLARALQALHDVHLVHRDIKPANVMVRDHGRGAVLIDFGLVRESDHRVAGLHGSLKYMAPEQVLYGPVAVDARTDVYALAMSLHHALRGSCWTDVESVTELVRLIAFREPPLDRWQARNVPDELPSVLAHALAKDPDERYASAGAFAEDLDALLEERPPSTSGWVARRRSAILRRPRTVALLVAAVLVTAAVFAESWFRHRRELADLVDRARDHMVAGAAREAAAILRPAYGRFHGDSAYDQLYGEAVHMSALGRMVELLRKVAFSIPEARRVGLDRALRDAAQQDLQRVNPNPYLVVCVVLDHFVRDELDAADAALAELAERGVESPLIDDLRHLVRVERDGELPSPDTIVALMGELPRADPDRCMRALLLERIRTDLTREEEHDRRLSERLRLRFRSIATGILENDDAHQLSLALVALADLDGPEPWLAVEPLELLFEIASDAVEIGVRFQLTRAKIAHASRTYAGQLDDGVRAELRRLARSLHEVESGEGADRAQGRLLDKVTHWVNYCLDNGREPIDEGDSAPVPVGPALGVSAGLVWFEVLGAEVFAWSASREHPLNLFKRTLHGLLIESDAAALRALRARFERDGVLLGLGADHARQLDECCYYSAFYALLDAFDTRGAVAAEAVRLAREDRRRLADDVDLLATDTASTVLHALATSRPVPADAVRALENASSSCSPNLAQRLRDFMRSLDR